MENLYKILEVDKDASLEVIKKAYRALAEKYHPDRNFSKQSEEKMKQINHAYSVLSDPKKRSQYDNQAIFLSGSGFFKQQRGPGSFISMLFEVIFVLALAKFLAKTFPPLLLFAIPGTILYLFVKFPKAFAKLYVKSVRGEKK